jgi:hypothetical protein
MIEFKATEITYYIVSSNDFSIIHYGVMKPGMYLKSGQQIFEQFETQEDLVERLEKLGVVQIDKEKIDL